MSTTPFILVPWQHNFIPAILNVALERDDLANALFIFPHARPAHYLERSIREDSSIKKPCLMPQCLTGSQLFQAIWNENNSPARPVGTLDRIGLLLECLRSEQNENPGLISRIPVSSISGDAKAFFPWGRRLANLFEECFNHGRVPESFMHLEDELMPFASAILSRLGSLYRRYISALEARGWTTPGFTAKNALEAISAGQNPRVLSLNKHIYICGYASLSGTEDMLFKRLWLEHKATVLIHADPTMPQGKEHWSCASLAEWQRSWGAKLDPMPVPKSAGPVMNFYAGYDVHSQLAFLRRGIHKRGDELGRELEDTAVILPDTSLLLPVLHHIQAEDVNISMGYPLSNTALQRFLDAILALHENARDGFYWKDCIRLLRQPYMKMLDESLDKNGRSTWRELLLKAEHKFRGGRRYVDLAQNIEECFAELETGDSLKEIKTLWDNARLVCVDLWQNLSCLHDLAEILEQLVNLLLTRGENIWPRFPIDAECLYRFAQSLIPELKNSSMAQERLPQSAIFSIFRELAKAERVPFDAYPLTVLQIMGLLESRLLSFKSVFILDATDDLLPGGIQSDPLLPDSLRSELGLPNASRRQRLMAYYFFRLLQSAEEVHVFWQEGVQPQGILDAKKLRSRFVEELIWREEQKQGRLLKPHEAVPATAPEHPPLLADGPLFQIGSRLSSFKQQHRTINVDGETEARLKQVLSANISATQLNNYMRCPASFYYRELAVLKPTQAVIEDEDPIAVGNLIHQVLKDYHSEHLGRPIKNEAMRNGELARIFQSAMRDSLSIDDMSSDNRIYLGQSGERSLKNYLSNQPSETIIQALELAVSAPLSTTGGKTFRLHGYLDRIDERIQPDGKPGLVILDYKTGRVEPIPPEIWSMKELWERLETDEPDLTDQDFFCQLADLVHDVQLPFYLYLASFGQADAELSLAGVSNAGWITLREKGEERFIFPAEFTRELRTEIIEDKISLLLDYLLRHLATTKKFFPRPGKRCDYCEYSNICIVLSEK